jgi:hypothetical protein
MAALALDSHLFMFVPQKHLLIGPSEIGLGGKKSWKDKSKRQWEKPARAEQNQFSFHQDRSRLFHRFLQEEKSEWRYKDISLYLLGVDRERIMPRALGPQHFYRQFGP